MSVANLIDLTVGNETEITNIVARNRAKSGNKTVDAVVGYFADKLDGAKWFGSWVPEKDSAAEQLLAEHAADLDGANVALLAHRNGTEELSNADQVELAQLREFASNEIIRITGESQQRELMGFSNALKVINRKMTGRYITVEQGYHNTILHGEPYPHKTVRAGLKTGFIFTVKPVQSVQSKGKAVLARLKLAQMSKAE